MIRDIDQIFLVAVAKQSIRQEVFNPDISELEKFKPQTPTGALRALLSILAQIIGRYSRMATLTGRGIAFGLKTCFEGGLFLLLSAGRHRYHHQEN